LCIPPSIFTPLVPVCCALVRQFIFSQQVALGMLRQFYFDRYRQKWLFFLSSAAFFAFLEVPQDFFLVSLINGGQFL